MHRYSSALCRNLIIGLVLLVHDLAAWEIFTMYTFVISEFACFINHVLAMFMTQRKICIVCYFAISKTGYNKYMTGITFLIKLFLLDLLYTNELHK